jgi:hypothetical protein
LSKELFLKKVKVYFEHQFFTKQLIEILKENEYKKIKFKISKHSIYLLEPKLMVLKVILF